MPKKDNPFSTKPFGEYGDSSADPFQDATVPAADAGAWTEDRRGAWGGSGQPATIPLDNGPSKANGSEIQMDYIKRKDQLDLKEKELAAREAELNKQRKELEKAGALKPKKNWPRCYPITYHDIAKDVPEGNRRMVRNCYWAFLGFLVAVTWNWFGALMALCVINPGSGRLAGFLLATIYWFAGVPGAWILWYMRIYNVAIRDRALVYAWFFLMFAVHEAFCIWSAVSPPLPFTSDWSHTGFVTAIKAFTPSTFVGVVYIIGGVFWSLEALWGFWALKGVYSHFRSGNGVRRAQQEAAGAAAGAVASRAVGSRNFGAGDV